MSSQRFDCVRVLLERMVPDLGIDPGMRSMIHVDPRDHKRGASRFPGPDLIDLGRGDNKHLPFGAGPHFCLGAPLAHPGSHRAIRTLVARSPDYRLGAAPPSAGTNSTCVS